MDFTREPIIETIITPREGCKLVVRCNKSNEEEHFVDAVEVVSFGSTFFFRSKERPKPFLLPATDYEVLEVREARMVLKTPTTEQQSKTPAKDSKRRKKEKDTEKPEKKRRSHRKKAQEAEPKAEDEKQTASEAIITPPPLPEAVAPEEPVKPAVIIPPPETLISESIDRYKENFKDVFIAQDDTISSTIEPEPIAPPADEEEPATAADEAGDSSS